MQSIDVIYHSESDGYWAEAPDVSGFYAAGDTLAEVREQVRGGLRFHAGADVTFIEHFPDAASVVTGVQAAMPDTWFMSAAVVVGSAVTAASGRLTSRLVPSAVAPATIKVTYGG